MKLFKIWNIFDTFCSLVFTTQLLPLSTSLSAVIIADFELYHIPPLFIVLYLEHLLFAFLVVSSCACLLSFLFSCQTVCLRLSPVIICLNHGCSALPRCVCLCVVYVRYLLTEFDIMLTVRFIHLSLHLLLLAIYPLFPYFVNCLFCLIYSLKLIVAFYICVVSQYFALCRRYLFSGAF